MSVSNGPRLGTMISAATGDNFDADFRKFLRQFHALVQCSVKSITLTAPPGSPVNGDAYIVGASATGAWSGHDKALAFWTTDNPVTPSGLWEFYGPTKGFGAFNETDSTVYFYNGTSWTAVGGGGGGGGMGSLVGYRRTAQWFAKPSNAGALVVNGEIFTVLGTEVNGRESPDANQGEATSYDNASADTPSGWQGSTLLNWWMGDNLHFFGESYLATITDILFLAGLLGASNQGGSTPAAGIHGYYFRFDITAGDTAIQCITSDGTRTITSSGITPVAGQSYRFLIVVDDVTPTVKFYIDDLLVATNATHIPTGARCIPQISGAWHTGTTSPLLGNSQMAVQADR